MLMRCFAYIHALCRRCMCVCSCSVIVCVRVLYAMISQFQAYMHTCPPASVYVFACCHSASILHTHIYKYIHTYAFDAYIYTQDSLGGNTKTVMVANMGPADYNYDETLSTLRFVCT